MASRSGERVLSQITHVVIHHDANPNLVSDLTGLSKLAKSYDKRHGGYSYAMYTKGEYGHKYISYHFMFNKVGNSLQVQDLKYKRHCAGDGAAYYKSKHNTKSTNHVGVHMMLNGYYHPPHNQVPTKEIIEAVARCIYELEIKLNRSLKIVGHREVSSKYTACPGNKIMTPERKYITMIIDRVNQMHQEDADMENWKAKVRKLDNVFKGRSQKDTYLIDFIKQERVKKYLKDTYMEFPYIYNDKYFMTQYSYDKNISNGFVKDDFQKPVEEPEPDPEEDKYKKLYEEMVKQNKELKTSLEGLEEIVEKDTKVIAELTKQNKELMDMFVKVKEKNVKLKEELTKCKGSDAKDWFAKLIEILLGIK